MASSSTAPDGDAVKYIGKNVRLNEKFTCIGCKVVADFVDAEQDRVAFFNYA